MNTARKTVGLGVLACVMISFAFGSSALAQPAEKAGGKDKDAELKKLIAKAEKGDPKAQYKLGLKYSKGRGVEVVPQGGQAGVRQGLSSLGGDVLRGFGRRAG